MTKPSKSKALPETIALHTLLIAAFPLVESKGALVASMGTRSAAHANALVALSPP
jgi:hypothetical protein